MDDHPSFRASARAVLEPQGSTSSARLEDGASAIRAVGALDPDVVLLDIQLPDMSGFDVCAEIAAAKATMPDVILVSSRDLADYGELV